MREHYGDILLKLRKKDAAKEQWIRSLELDPKNQKLRDRYRKAGFGDPDAVVSPDQPAKKEKKEKKEKKKKQPRRPSSFSPLRYSRCCTPARPSDLRSR